MHRQRHCATKVECLATVLIGQPGLVNQRTEAIAALQNEYRLAQAGPEWGYDNTVRTTMTLQMLKANSRADRLSSFPEYILHGNHTGFPQTRKFPTERSYEGAASQ